MTDLLDTAKHAAREAGSLLRDNFRLEKKVDEFAQYDIKLDLDVRSQDLISEIILGAHPDHAIYGEEGVAGNADSDVEWIVDPIDGTVNYYFGIPHFCVSIAIRTAGELSHGVIYDPMMDEMWEVQKGGVPLLNGAEIHASDRAEMKQAVVTVGFSKSKESLEAGMLRYAEIAYQVRKTRMLGSAALAMAYIACGRLDAYIEEIISVWDIAAGQLLVEAAGGKVDLLPRPDLGPEKSSICAWNGRLPLDGQFG